MALWCRRGFWRVRMEKTTSPESAIQAVPLSSNRQHWKFSSKIKKCCQGAPERESWQEPSHGLMRGLNQLSSTVHHVHHCCTIRTQGHRGGTQIVLRCHLHERVVYFMQSCPSNNAGHKKGVCVRERDRVVNHGAATARHSSSLKTIACCPCRWQRQWCTPVFSFDVCGQGRAVSTWPDILRHRWWHMYGVVALFCQVKRFYENETISVTS